MKFTAFRMALLHPKSEPFEGAWTCEDCGYLHGLVQPRTEVDIRCARCGEVPGWMVSLVRLDVHHWVVQAKRPLGIG